MPEPFLNFSYYGLGYRIEGVAPWALETISGAFRRVQELEGGGFILDNGERQQWLIPPPPAEEAKAA